MKLKNNIFVLLCFIFIIMISISIYLYFIGVKRYINKNDLFVITKKLNTDEYNIFFQENFNNIKDINIENILNSNIFYDNLKDFNIENNKLENIEENYIKKKISIEKFNNYLKKHTGYNITDFNTKISDETDESMNFIHTKNQYVFKTIDCLEGYKRKKIYYLSCYISGDKKEHIIKLKSSKTNYIFISNSYDE